MKRYLPLLFMALLPMGALAQPPEESPQPAPDAAAPAPAPVAPIPVAEPQAPAPSAAAPAEDKTIRGVTINPGIGIYPFGYDKVNVGETTESEGGKMFFSLKPNFGISSAFKTATGRTISVDTGYSLEWREYYNKGTTDRDFTHDIPFVVNSEWNSLISTNIDTLFEYFFKAGTDAEADNSILLDVKPRVWFTAKDNLKFSVGYWMRYIQLIDAPVDPDGQNSSDGPPTDIDDLRRGSVVGGGSGFDSYSSPGAYDLFGNSGYLATAASKQDAYMFHNMISTGAKYTPIKGTSLSFEYAYNFKLFSNDDNNEWTGHWFYPGVSQAMPWRGGNVSLKFELRLRKFDSTTVSDGVSDYPRQDFRLRGSLILTQAINDYVNFIAYFRPHITGNNGDNYDNLRERFWTFTGVEFSF